MLNNKKDNENEEWSDEEVKTITPVTLIERKFSTFI